MIRRHLSLAQEPVEEPVVPELAVEHVRRRKEKIGDAHDRWARKRVRESPRDAPLCARRATRGGRLVEGLEDEPFVFGSLELDLVEERQRGVVDVRSLGDLGAYG